MLWICNESLRRLPPIESIANPLQTTPGVLIYKPQAKVEVINDTNTLLVSFLTSLKRDFGLLTTLLLSTPKSAYLLKKAQFIARYAEHFDCTSKARAFWVLANLNELLINKVNSSRHFEAFKKKQPSFLNKLSKRLHHLLIESSDPIQLIKSTDSEHTLFFINPNPIHL